MSISEKDLFDARTAWGNGLIEISETFENEGIEMATSIASDMIDNLYGFNFGEVLFKPTLSGGSQTFAQLKRELFLILLVTIQRIQMIAVLASSSGAKLTQILPQLL